jgi:hypothetical protein
MYLRYKNVRQVPIEGIAPNEIKSLPVHDDGFLLSVGLRTAVKQGDLIEVKDDEIETASFKIETKDHKGVK